jgi:S-adenosylmethionine synthetase
MDAENFSRKMLKQKLSFSISRNYFSSLNFKFIFIMAYLFTSESVSEGHPDKIADQIRRIN